MDMDMVMDMDVDMDMDMDIDVYHRLNLELACNVGSRLFLLGMVLRREFRAICCCPNIFCHKMITSGLILMFHVSMELY